MAWKLPQMLTTIRQPAWSQACTKATQRRSDRSENWHVGPQWRVYTRRRRKGKVSRLEGLGAKLIPSEAEILLSERLLTRPLRVLRGCTRSIWADSSDKWSKMVSKLPKRTGQPGFQQARTLLTLNQSIWVSKINQNKVNHISRKIRSKKALILLIKLLKAIQRKNLRMVAVGKVRRKKGQDQAVKPLDHINRQQMVQWIQHFAPLSKSWSAPISKRSRS